MTIGGGGKSPPISRKMQSSFKKMSRLLKKLIEKFAESKKMFTFAVPSLNDSGA